MRIAMASAAGLVLAWTLGLSAQAPAPAAPAPCVAAGDVRFICNLQAPEDLVVVPGAQWVVASAFGGSGGLYVIRVSDRTPTLVYPAQSARDALDAKAYPSCPGAPDAAAKAKFSTHGLSLVPGRGSVHRLYVVVHGSRESIEVFDLDAGKNPPSLTWGGCVVAAEPVGLNSVRGLPDGGFIASNFLARGISAEGRQRMQGGETNGELWEWHSASGWQKVPRSEAAGANGLEMSEDGRWLYVAAWGSQSFFRLSRGQATPQRDEVPLGFRVDNIRWARDGSLLAAGQGGVPPMQTTNIVRIDPKTMMVRELVKSANTDGFGAGTVAVEIGNDLWVGSFRGDRLAIFPAKR